jgi:cation:H+ antiporter
MGDNNFMMHFVRKRVSGLDFASWLLVILFFGIATIVFHGVLSGTLLGAFGIVLLMLVITLSINTILDVMRNHPRAGEMAGYITNGPEALCVLVGLFSHKLMFAVSVPIGSNFVNPLLLVLAIYLGRRSSELFQPKALLAGLTLLLTVVAAGLFYLGNTVEYRWGWAILALGASLLFYHMREHEDEPEEEEIAVEHPILLIPAIMLLVAAGYFLDPLVSFTAAESKLPEGIIGFLVLSFLSSWPEFRSSIALIQRDRLRSAFVNIYISNITNLWLAIAGTIIFLLMGGK